MAITFHHDGKTTTVDGKAGDSLLQIALDAGIPIESACGGNGFCTTCLCNINKGMEHTGERTDREDNMGVVSDPERLTCQTVYDGEGEVEIEVLDM